MEKASEKLLIKYAKALDNSKKIIRTLDSEKGYELCYLLYHPIVDFFVANCTDKYGENMFEFIPNNFMNNIEEIPEMSFDIEDNFLTRLSGGYEIAYISNPTLYGILGMIVNYGYEDFEDKEGISHLLEYCKTYEIDDKRIVDIVSLLENEILNIEVEGTEEDVEME